MGRLREELHVKYMLSFGLCQFGRFERKRSEMVKFQNREYQNSDVCDFVTLDYKRNKIANCTNLLFQHPASTFTSTMHSFKTNVRSKQC